MDAIRKHWRDKAFYYAMLAPLVVIMLALYAYPVARGAYLAFTDYNYLAADPTPRWTGLDNFVSFFKDREGRQVLWNTVRFTAIVVTIETVLGLGLALALNRDFRGKGVARALILVPLMLAPVVVGYEWRWLYNDPYGLINYALMQLGVISAPISWTTSAATAMASLVIADVWNTTPFVAILCLGGLQSLPEEPLEAAIVDGASPVQRFLYVTLPLLRPVLLAAILIRFMDAFQTFDLVFILTYGGPGNLTELMNTYTYKTAFLGFDLGYASAIALVSLLLMTLFSVVLARTINRNA
jgi:ABC-type sugar transport system permease subunit